MGGESTEAAGGKVKGIGPGEEESSWNQLVGGCIGVGERMVKRGGAEGEELGEVLGLTGPGGPTETRTMSGARAQQTNKIGEVVHKRWEARRGSWEGKVYYD
ncbi:hypothetical protein AX14_003443 [Amanita brunnescens Koide BX004]|nr:hypothetical protein AX14_003443 [Amanita brunnescens Koide BX004]